MRTYEFHCTTCDRTFELEESIVAHDEHLRQHDHHCPGCRSDAVEQQVTTFEVETHRKS
jgi:putative FmdB family regulatory protein